MSSRTIRMGLAFLTVLSATGCHGGAFYRGGLVASDPAFVAVGPGAASPRRATFVDRHPLFRKPVEVYESHGSKPVCKAAAAAVIGVPAGIVGEIRQIIVGCPPGF